MPRNNKPQTNVQVVKRLMEYSNHGAIMQPFVLEAIRRYAEQCIAAGPAHFDSPMLHGAAWVGCAKEARAALIEHLGS